ncbi:PhzF family phenazine biosynthesis protein [Fuscibacter oryzae]|uniref:PhzF family phenazine biosynthesis protein n=1 Tax=Fuscibacter oryzae TaxID=2803939 RepID=A0A8J7MR83_9RHOB|nr:PhzF family phenazine biosynthesis protein [Fuscibacter oryzae]MBL4927389.1 PhzF family phenazine biosynthesis protein [Fuscibacter oryzae]
MLAFHTLDVFTTRRYAGNPLAVVLGADGLTTAQMQTIAREFNLSETIFVMAPRDPAHTARVRIFFPTAEIPFAGHPTVGCALLLADLAGTPETVITLEEEAGLVPVTIRDGVAEFVAPVVPFTLPFTPDRALAAAALDLPEGALGPDIGLAQGGPKFLYVPLTSLDALARARPIEPHWSALMAAAGVDSAYLYTPGLDCDFRARMFSPTAGIPEDPATGSATALLAARLLAAGQLADGETRLTLHQGVEMGRPSVLHLTAVAAKGALHQVRIAGTAVRISAGQITPP